MNKRKILSLFLALSLCVGMLTVPASAAGEFPYSDVPADAWYAEAVRYAHESGIMNGTGDGVFSPNATTTRATVVTLLHRAEKTPEATGEAFTDVPADAWYAKAVAWASANKIVNGTGGGLFSPDAVITREQFAAILYRYAGFKSVDVSKVADLSNFPDADSVSGFAKTAVAWAVEVGLISGTNLGTLDPLGSATRAQAATILMRYEKNVAAMPAPTPTAAPKPSRRPSSSGGGSSSTSYSNLTVAESKTVDEAKTYQDVTITDAVGDGTVTLANMTILGNLYINGGGAHTVNLTNVVIKGKIIMAKVGGETPRLNLVNTPVNTVEVERPAAIQADAASTVAAVQARASVYAVGSDTVITAVTVPAGVKEKVYVVANDTAVVQVVNAKSETAVSGATNAVKEVVAEAPVTVTADAVKKVEVPATAPENVTVAVTGAGSVEVAVNSEKGAAITTEADEEGNKASVEVSTKLDTPPTVTVDGEEKHIHQWGEWVSVDDGHHKRVCKADESHVETQAHSQTGWVSVDGESHRDTCTVCDWSETKPHHIVAIGEAVAADCLGPGKTAGKKCDYCDTILEEQKTIEPLGHDFSGKYLNDAEGHWHKCTRCDKIDEKAAHTYPAGATCDTATNCTVCNYEKPAGQHTWDAGKVTKEPTETEAGIKTYTCTTCKATKTEAVPAVGKDTPITFTQNKNEITASWTGFSETKYAYCFRNQSDERVTGYYWTQEGSNTSYNLHYELPRLESGTASYDFVLYAVTNNMLGQELARVKNAATVTVAGEPISYNMDFAYDTYTSGSTTSQKSKVTWPDDKQPAGIWQISAWYRGEETAPHAAGGGSITPTLEFIQKIQDGDIFDLRILTAFELDGQTIKATMTPASTKTYTATGNDPEVGDEITIGTPELKTDGSKVWVEATVENLPADAKIGIWISSNSNSPSVTLGRSSKYFVLDGNNLKCYLDQTISTQFLGGTLALSVIDTDIKTAYTTKALTPATPTNSEEILVATKAEDSASITVSKQDGSKFEDKGVYGCTLTVPDIAYTCKAYFDSLTADGAIKFKDYNNYVPTATGVTVYQAIPTEDENGVTVNFIQYSETTFTTP